MTDVTIYATMKTLHLLALIVWVGGMFFTLACLRPSLGVLEGPMRLRLMHAVFGRFFTIVDAAIGLLLLTGLGMLWFAWRAANGANTPFSMPLSWHLMIVLGLVMMGLFGHIRASLFKRLGAAVQAQDAATGAALLGRIRKLVTVNFALGVLIVVAMKLGAAG